MSFEHILLGLIGEQPRTGYDIKQDFEGGAGNFWSAELSQIYPALKRLTSKGFLDVHDEPGQRGRARRVYSLTDSGRRKFLAWLDDEPHTGPVRLEELAQLWFMNRAGGAQRTRRFLNELAEHARTRLTHLEQIERDWAESTPCFPSMLEPDELHQYMTLVNGLTSYRARLDWIERCIELLEPHLQTNTKEESTHD